MYLILRKKNAPFLLVATVVVALILTLSVTVCVKRTSDKMTKYSFQELTDSTKMLAEDIFQSANVDGMLLRVTAELIAARFDQGEAAVLEAMNTFDRSASFISSIELLSPENEMLYQDGAHRSAEGVLDFETEAEKGGYISERSRSIKDPTDLVVRCAEPVVQDGETVAILYGVISLKNFSEQYHISLYGGEAFVMVTDGTSGDVLLDTWHNELGNMDGMNDRVMLKGYSFATARQAMREGAGGDLAFISQSAGEAVYLHFEPIGINNWNVTLGVRRAVALEKSLNCTKDLYWMAGTVAVVMLLYLALVVWSLSKTNQKIYELSVTDQGTMLLNRSAYEMFLQQNRNRLFAQASCIYVDANGLHELNNRKGHAAGDEMLRTVAQALKQHFPDAKLFRIGGDEFVVFVCGKPEDYCEQKMQEIVSELEKHQYSISYGIASLKNKSGLESVVQQADERMLQQKKSYHAANSLRSPR